MSSASAPALPPRPRRASSSATTKKNAAVLDQPGIVPGALLGFTSCLLLQGLRRLVFGGGSRGSSASKQGSGSSATSSPSSSPTKKAVKNTIGYPAVPGVELKMVLCVRTDLGMSTGKVAAQCAHAAWSMRAKLAKSHLLLKLWNDQGQKKIAVKCESESQMAQLAAKARKMSLPQTVIRDAGRTQVAAGSATVLAIGPAPSSKIDEVTGQLKLL
ncbi:hypothetical protein PPROV_000257100 [Pycnococcus provasolii]|uniref:peptidyl-tRNA hydrolase n=1 Tax=Pycnococcus provasolii TaxID=41880 RepID=A0A7R9XPJ9_9CHLO|nr:hypothetical protein PPROV_000257100 [Pycnococcus provasolii]|mmetsp:Transcript_3489/g.7862  ORF Transcript_3489/g.7862 Transcript_3489/m.7862 type:complete len:215 (+) Transcript_3489:3-647(+)